MITPGDLLRVAANLQRLGGWNAAASMVRETAKEIEQLRAANERMEWRLRYYTEPDRWLDSECGYCLTCSAHPETCECGEYTPRKLPEVQP